MIALLEILLLEILLMDESRVAFALDPVPTFRIIAELDHHENKCIKDSSHP